MRLKQFISAIAFICTLLPGLAYSQSSGEELFLQGNNLYNQKKYQEAVASYVRAIQIQPMGQPKAYLNCARAYTMLKDYPSARKYYEFYEEVDPDSAADRKVKAEYKAVEKKAKGQDAVQNASQTTVLNQINTLLASNGPYLTRQGNGALAYYDVLIRAGYAEPDLYYIQKKIISGMTTELEVDITPPPGQPLPNLDRTGWEFIHTKISKLHQFADVQPDSKYLSAVDALATAWEAYYRDDYVEAMKAFNTACQYKPALPAAYWGRLMLNFQLEKVDILLNGISETEAVYKKADITGMEPYFNLLRAQAYRNLREIEKSLESLSKMQEGL